MVEIYNYDITTHERFARDQQDIEAFRKQYHLPPSGAGVVAIRSKVLDFVPKHPAIDLLMRTYQRKNWADFSMPEKFKYQNESSHIAPSLGSNEKQDADIHRLEAFLKRKTHGRFVRKQKQEQQNNREKQDKRQRHQQPENEEQETIREGEILIDLLEKGVLETNKLVDYVFARMHQFVQA